MGILVIPITARADVQPNALFSSGAVLQQGMSVPVWGTASEGEKVTVSFEGQRVSTVARGGKWMVRLKPLRAGGPFQMIISGENEIRLGDIYVGEVWVCSGQSNMQMPLEQTENADQVIAASKDPMLRLFTVPNIAADEPAAAVNAVWRECGPEAVAKFSAVGYFFGRDLRRALKVPIGLIDSSWGGTAAQAWTSPSALAASPEFRGMLPDPSNPGEGPHRGGVLFNGMIAPLLPYAIRGAIWYQGESNAGAAYQYRTLFPTMIRSWREAWGQGDFPFLFVQLAPWQPTPTNPAEGTWPELREAQLLTAKTCPNTAMVVITDCGDEKDIHPKRKEPVGVRLAIAARAIAYGEKIEYSGPIYKSMIVKGDRVILYFDHVGSGLVAKGGELKGFTIAGEDRVFHPARASIYGSSVIVSSPEVARPVAVRYGWQNYPIVNLYNREGLPASPFRTDDFPMVTKPR